MLSIKEIKFALDNGKKVESSKYSMSVIKDCKGQYLIKSGNYCIGLHGQEGTKFENVPNYTESDCLIIK